MRFRSSDLPIILAALLFLAIVSAGAILDQRWGTPCAFDTSETAR